MTSRDFCFWLRGYLASVGTVLTPGDAKRIAEELGKIAPDPAPIAPIYPWYCATNTSSPLLPPAGVTIT